MGGYRQPHDSVMVKVANIYLFHAMEYARKECYGLKPTIPVDEKLCRLLETYAGIEERNVLGWRVKVLNQFCEHRMDGLYTKMMSAFRWLVESQVDLLVEYLAKYKVVPGLTRMHLLEDSEVFGKAARLKEMPLKVEDRPRIMMNRNSNLIEQ